MPGSGMTEYKSVRYRMDWMHLVGSLFRVPEYSSCSNTDWGWVGLRWGEA